jgi:TorA maturation chaperone TorD
VTPADRLAIYLEIAAALRATGERGSELAALLVEQLADEVDDVRPIESWRR